MATASIAVALLLFYNSTPEVENIGILRNIRSMVSMGILFPMAAMIGMKHHQRISPPAALRRRIQLFEPLDDRIQRRQRLCPLRSMGMLRIVVAQLIQEHKIILTAFDHRLGRFKHSRIVIPGHDTKIRAAGESIEAMQPLAQVTTHTFRPARTAAATRLSQVSSGWVSSGVRIGVTILSTPFTSGRAPEKKAA